MIYCKPHVQELEISENKKNSICYVYVEMKWNSKEIVVHNIYLASI